MIRGSSSLGTGSGFFDDPTGRSGGVAWAGASGEGEKRMPRFRSFSSEDGSAGCENPSPASMACFCVTPWGPAVESGGVASGGRRSVRFEASGEVVPGSTSGATSRKGSGQLSPSRTLRSSELEGTGLPAFGSPSGDAPTRQRRRRFFTGMTRGIGTRRVGCCAESVRGHWGTTEWDDIQVAGPDRGGKEFGCIRSINVPQDWSGARAHGSGTLRCRAAGFQRLHRNHTVVPAPAVRWRAASPLTTAISIQPELPARAINEPVGFAP